MEVLASQLFVDVAFGLLFWSGMKIELRTETPEGPDSAAEQGRQASEVLEGGDEFLEALQLRLNEIIRKPNGRFVISYVAGQPGAKNPPRIQ